MRTRFALMASALLLGACGREAAAPASTVVRDSAGVRIVEVVPSWDEPAPFRVSPEPVYRVGWGADGPAFEEVAAGALWPDGRAVVGDGGRTLRLVLLSPTGAVEGTLGQPGQGPGELASISSIGVIDDERILVQDAFAGRLSVFSRDGSVETHTLDRTTYLRILGWDDARGEALLGMPLAIVVGRRYETPWLSIPLVRLDPATARADTVGFADWDQSLDFDGRNPFASGGFAAASGGDFVLGRGDRPEIRWVGSDGALRQIVRWQATPVPVSDSILAVLEAATRQSYERSTLPPEMVEPRITEILERARGPLPYFGTPGMPDSRGLLSDPDGNVWIAEYQPQGLGFPPRYHVVTAEGEWLGAVRMPEGVAVLAIGRDHLLGAEASALGEQAVALYAIER